MQRKCFLQLALPNPTPGHQVTPIPPTYLHVSKCLHQGDDLKLIQCGQAQDLFDFRGAAETKVTLRGSCSRVHAPPAPPCQAPRDSPEETRVVANSEKLNRYSKGFRGAPALEFGDMLLRPQITVCFLPAIITQLQDDEIIYQKGPRGNVLQSRAAGGPEGKSPSALARL